MRPTADVVDLERSGRTAKAPSNIQQLRRIDMRFRSYIALAISATALVPFLGWSVLQKNDVERMILEKDEVQERAANDVARRLEARLRTLENLGRYAAATLGDAARRSAQEDEVERILRELVEAFPTLQNLHLDHIRTEPGEEASAHVLAFHPQRTDLKTTLRGADHTERWHARAARRGLEAGKVVFSPVLLSSQAEPRPIVTFATPVPGTPHLLVSGAVSLGALLEDLEERIAKDRLKLTILTESQQIVWPYRNEPILRTWPEIPQTRTVLGSGKTAEFVTTANLPEGLPGWTIVVSASNAERTAYRSAVERRMMFLAAAVLLLALAAGWGAVRPLRHSLSQLEKDLDAEHFDTDETTIRTGPEELMHIQRVYREARRTLDAKNAELSETAERRTNELAAQELLFRSVFEAIEAPFLLLDASWTLRHKNPAAAAKLAPEELSLVLEAARVRWAHPANRAELRPSAGEALPEASGKTTAETSMEDVLLVELPAKSESDAGAPRTMALQCFPIGARRASLAGGFALLLEDVTERETLKRMKDDLLGIVAHELKTPVTACRLQVERLVDTMGEHPEFSALTQDLAHLQQIVADWLSVARIDGGAFTVHPEVVQLDPIVRKARRLVREKSDFRFTLAIAEEAECLGAARGRERRDRCDGPRNRDSCGGPRAHLRPLLSSLEGNPPQDGRNGTWPRHLARRV